MTHPSSLSPRAFYRQSRADTWEEIWEAGPYYQRLSELLETTQHYAIFAGWQIDSRLRLNGGETLREQVLRLCQSRPQLHFYFLMWDHAYFYVLEREWWQGRVWDELHPRVHFIFDNRHPFGGSHHEKICILDGDIAFVGGIDLCDERWDTPEHRFSEPRRSLDRRKETHGPYHDLAIQLSGPVCSELQSHVAQRWRVISNIPFPEPQPDRPPPAGTSPRLLYLSRTQSSIDNACGGQPLIREVEFLYRELIHRAERRILVEGQYFWSQEVADLLISKMEEKRGQDFEIILILANLAQARTFTRWMSTHELTLLHRLQISAANSGTRLTMGTPYSYPASENGSPEKTRNFAPKPIYIHSKLILIDDRYLCVGSANFAARALRIDTEICLTWEAHTFAEQEHLRKLGDHVLTHWRVFPSEAKETPSVRFRHFRPKREHTLIPYASFFDPKVPWLYGIKLRLRRLSRRRQIWPRLGILVIWLMAASLVFALSSASLQNPSAAPWSALYSALFSSVWFLPIPAAPLAVVATFHLGLESASHILVYSLWIASLIGYSLARAFPTAAARFYQRFGPSWLPERIRQRSFRAIIALLADPRVELRFKIAYQGLYCMPLPWFALATGLLLPAGMYLICRWSTELAPTTWIHVVQQAPLGWITTLLAISAFRAAIRNKGSKKNGKDGKDADEDWRKAA